MEVLDRLNDRICSIVDEDSTYEGGAVIVRQGFHQQLDAMKEQWKYLPGKHLCSFLCCWLVAFSTHKHLRTSSTDERTIGSEMPAAQGNVQFSAPRCCFCSTGNIIPGSASMVQMNSQQGRLRLFDRQLGFLIVIHQQHLRNSATGGHIEPPEGLRYFCTNDKEAKFYFKDREMDYLDTSIGDLDGLIKETEASIVSELQDDILDQEIELRETFLTLSELDCIVSFAVVAKDRNFTRPNILQTPQDGTSTTTAVRIKKGRHPLQEIVVGRDFVPNDIEIDDKKLVNVLTGPNFSGQLEHSPFIFAVLDLLVTHVVHLPLHFLEGKSCLARQLGVCVYLAQIGCFVPCDECSISIVDQIFTQFARVETCAVPQSSFQLDLTHMGTIFRKSTSRSLVIIDEFGKGKR